MWRETDVSVQTMMTHTCVWVAPGETSWDAVSRVDPTVGGCFVSYELGLRAWLIQLKMMTRCRETKLCFISCAAFLRILHGANAFLLDERNLFPQNKSNTANFSDSVPVWTSGIPLLLWLNFWQRTNLSRAGHCAMLNNNSLKRDLIFFHVFNVHMSNTDVTLNKSNPIKESF